MNKTVLMGRLTADPQVRYSQGDNATAVARYTLAVNRKFKKDGEPTALYSDVPLNLQRSISAKECKLLSQGVFRPEATQTRTETRCIQQM